MSFSVLSRSPRLKIERAKHHINDLHSRIADFGATDFYSLNAEKNIETAECRLKVEVEKPFPDDFALIIGDTVHNLKSALDVTVNEVVFRRLNRYDDYTRFPLRKTKDNLVSALNGGLIKQASEAVVEFIVNAVKPYKGGNDALWSLHDLNILDKHRLLLPVMQVTSIIDFCAEDDRGNRMENATLVVTRNRAVTLFASSGNIKITNKGKAIPLAFFDKGLPMEGQPVVPSLIQLTELVSNIVEGIESAFLSEQ
jgi:hypothetical protein